METENTNAKVEDFIEKQFEEVEEEFDSFFNLMKQALIFFRVNFNTLFSFFFLVLAVPNLFGLMLKKLVLPVISGGHSIWFSGLVVLFYSILGLTVSVVALMINFGSCRLIHSLDNQKKESLKDSFLNILKSSKTILACLALVILMLSGAAVALIVPAIFLGVGVIFVNQFILIEGKTAKEAIMQSLWYTKDKKITIFLKFACGFLFALLVSNIVFSIGNFFFGLVPVSLRGNVFQLFLSIFDFAVSAIVWAFIVTFVYFLWKNLKKIRRKTMTKSFEEKYQKIVKVFSIVGVVVIVLFFVLGIISSVLKVSQEIEVEQAQMQMLGK